MCWGHRILQKWIIMELQERGSKTGRRTSFYRNFWNIFVLLETDWCLPLWSVPFICSCNNFSLWKSDITKNFGDIFVQRMADSWLAIILLQYIKNGCVGGTINHKFTSKPKLAINYFFLWIINGKLCWWQTFLQENSFFCNFCLFNKKLTYS